MERSLNRAFFQSNQNIRPFRTADPDSVQKSSVSTALAEPKEASQNTDNNRSSFLLYEKV